MGRPSLYTPELAEAICQRLAEGESLRAICRDEAMPSEAAVRGWALDNVQGFSAQYARAREIGAYAMADEILEIVDDASNDWMERFKDGASVGYELNGDHVRRSQLRADKRQWLLTKMLPKVYGDKVEHTGADGGPISFTWQKPAE